MEHNRTPDEQRHEHAAKHHAEHLDDVRQHAKELSGHVDAAQSRADENATQHERHALDDQHHHEQQQQAAAERHEQHLDEVKAKAARLAERYSPADKRDNQDHGRAWL
ncbi:hypothetical protein RI367_000912 [Sorochytrium milnesiophthora]